MTAKELADLPTKSTIKMTYEERLASIETMLSDLNQLARKDGCIAAAWALEFLEEIVYAETF